MVVTKGTKRQGREVGRMSRRTAAWLAWSVCAVCVAFIVLTLPLDFFTDDRFTSGGFLFSQRPGPAFVVLTGMLSLVYPAVGAIIASRLPTNPIGWIFCGVGLLYTTQRFAQAYADYALLVNFAFPGGEYMAWFSRLVDVTGLVLAGVFVMLLFPDGSLPSRRWRIVAWTAVCGALLSSLYAAFYPDDVGTSAYYVMNPFGWVGVIGGGLTTYDFLFASGFIGETLLLTSSLAAICSVALRLHRAWGDERQQLKWFLYAAVPAALCFCFVLLSFIVLDFTELVFGTPLIPFWANYYDNILYVAVFALLVVPIFTYIAIVRHHLYDIDVVINRTLVYGALSACVIGIYVLAVVALGALFQAQGNLAVSLAATGLVAVLFQPIRSRLQRSVNRLMYGERDDPYAVLSRIGRRLEATIAPKAALSTIVETIAQALKVPYVAIEIRQAAEQFAKVAEHGTPKEEPLVLPLVYQRETIGRLVVAPRAPGETFSPADRRLLEDLARQVEVAVYAVRLTADLQRSRERLVTAREEERRRLRRDLHDGLGPTLGALTLGLDTTRLALAQEDPKAVDELLVELKSHTQDAVSDVRRLVYGLRPPALDDLGLVPAIRQQAANRGLLADAFPNGQGPKWENSKNGLVFRVEAPDDLPSLPAAVEVACYRIAQEALTNTARHSGASSCLVSLCLDEADGTLQLEVSDDGKGVAEDRSAGVGMSSMRERAEELGGTLTVGALPEGGTRILARLPLPAREVPRGEKRSS
jgi:two-component system NarL family sensor kinase